MRTYSFFIIGILCCITALSGCKRNIGMTSVRVKDSVRHYYPVLTGQTLNISYEIENIGKDPLIIRDIQPSCGCIMTSEYNHVVQPKQKIRLMFKYDSSKNIGYTRHVIRIHGNIMPYGIAKLIFDVNVVTNADYTRDYEELYKQANDKSDIIKGLVDGDETEKGYYFPDRPGDSRQHSRYPWLQEEEENE